MATLFAHHHRRVVAAGALSVALIILAACSGGGDSGPLTAGEAETIARDALLVSGDLPDRDWEETDTQAGIESLVPDIAGDLDLDILPDACSALEDAIGNLPALLVDVTPLATASRSFTATGQLLNLEAVSTSVVVFEEAAGAKQALAALETALSADNLEGCILAAGGSTGGDAGFQIVDFSLTTPSYALDDSTALTVSIGAIALILPVNITLDLHTFQRDNVLALYVGLEVNSNDLGAEHADLVATFVNRIEEAQN